MYMLETLHHLNLSLAVEQIVVRTGYYYIEVSLSPFIKSQAWI